MPKRTLKDGVYTRKDRKGYWISWADAQGRRRYRKTNAKSLAHARHILAAERIRVEQTKVIGFTPPGEEMFEEIATKFLAHQKARLTPKAYERDSGVVENHLKPFFKMRIAAIRRVDVQRYVTQRSIAVSAHSVMKELNILKHLLRLAVEWEVVPVSVGMGIKGPKVPAGRVRYLQPTELRKLVGICPEWLQPIVALAVSTGMRRSEILGLRWLDVDMERAHILLPQTKNGDGRIVYLNDSAHAVLSSYPMTTSRLATDLIFRDITPGQVTIAFRRACGKVKILDFRFHDLRHTAASWMRMSGADIHTVAQILGHKDLRMAARYQHLSPAFLAEAVARLDGVFGNLCYQDATDVKKLEVAPEVTH